MVFTIRLLRMKRAISKTLGMLYSTGISGVLARRIKYSIPKPMKRRGHNFQRLSPKGRSPRLQANRLRPAMIKPKAKVMVPALFCLCFSFIPLSPHLLSPYSFPPMVLCFPVARLFCLCEPNFYAKYKYLILS